MDFKRSSLLSANVVVGYFSSTRNGTTKKVKFRTKQVTQVDSYCFPQMLLTNQHIKCVRPMTFSQKLANSQTDFKVQDFVFGDEQACPNADSLSKVKRFLDNIFLLNAGS